MRIIINIVEEREILLMKYFFIFSVVLIAGCGGGGGSSAVVKNPATYYETTEYDSQYGLSNIKASDIYLDGYSGSGVTVAVIDTGVDLDHPDLVANIASGGYDFIDNDADANPDGQGAFMSHGTHVAGIIAGVKNDVGMHGVAYSAKILALRAGDSDGSLFTSAIENSIDLAISQGAKVINASFGSSDIGTSTKDKWLSAHNNDIVSVHAAGNDSNTDPDYGAKLPADSGYEALENTLIAVVATDSSNTIANYSNQCGVAKNWCMAAPGSGIYSTVDTTDDNHIGGDGYATSNGTSMAAPHVSGAVAVLRSKWPSKSASEVVTILYDTATDLGDAGIDVVYGRGLLNLDNAIYAQGALTVATASGGSHYLSDSGFSSSGVLGDALVQSIETAVYDKYKRDYYFNLNKVVLVPKSALMSTELKFEDTIQRGIQIDKSYQNLQVSFAQDKSVDKVFAFDDKTNITGLSDTYSLYADSHLSQIDHATVINVASTGNIKTSLGMVSGYTDKNKTHAINGVNAAVLVNSTDDFSFSVQLSHLNESETFLSNYFRGAYQTGIAKTNAINLIVSSKLSNKVEFIAQYSKGRTKVNPLKDSVVSSVSTIDTKGYSMSVVANTDSGTLFATFKRPMKVTQGNMTLTSANGLNADDSISFINQDINLSPSASEENMTLGYLSDYNNNTFVLLLNHKNNTNHDVLAKSEQQIMLKMSYKF